jgi:cytochrome c
MRVAPQSPYASAARLRAPVLGLVLGLVLLAGCDKGPEEKAPVSVSGGNIVTGKKLIAQYQCGSCHAIPGIAGAKGVTAPSLDGFGRHAYIAGVAPNFPDPLINWIMDPQSLKPGTTMPGLVPSTNEARHIAAYLYTLR